MTEIRFDTYYRYDAITDFLRRWTEHFPNLSRLESLGPSHEGRDIWIMVLTNFDTGPDIDKPAYWVDGNIHATEVSASTTALYLIHKLLTQYGHDQKVTYALDSRAFYVAPRLNPDGAEWALADNPKFVRSSTRPYPRPDELDGLHREDIDGNGRILQMRLKDPNGPWKIHPEEPRLLVQRDPDEPPGGDFYRLLPEGRIRNYDGVLINLAPPLQGLDLNRQFPIFWEPKERGAGPSYKLLEKEIAPLADFAIYSGLVSPRLELHSIETKSSGDMHYIRCVVHNTGWLPTNVTQKALDMKTVRELEVDIALPEGATLISGEAKTKLGQLKGRDDKSALVFWGGDATSDRAKVEWVVQAPAGTEVEITAVHQRAGVVRATIAL